MNTSVSISLSHDETISVNGHWPAQIQVGDDTLVDIYGEKDELAKWFRAAAARFTETAATLEVQHAQDKRDLAWMKAELARLEGEE